MQKWIVTGVSGSGRIELLNELEDQASRLGKNAIVHDVGALIRQEARRNKIPITDERVLDMDRSQLRLLRSAALKEVRLVLTGLPDADLHLIGVHATFPWKGRLIPGILYQDVLDIKPDGFINVVRDVSDICETNRKNPKWDKNEVPDVKETQEWMIQEEFVTEVLAEVSSVPVYLVARSHHTPNLADLFFTRKKKIYLSYPITAVRDSNPSLLDEIQGPVLSRLEELFVVFNPLTIQGIPLTYPDAGEKVPELVDQLTPKAKEIIKKRTIERDFQFIDQSDALVAFYLTDKVSPGVLAEIYYAYRNQKPVFMAFQGSRSPFIEDATTCIESSIDAVMQKLAEFAQT